MRNLEAGQTLVEYYSIVCIIGIVIPFFAGLWINGQGISFWWALSCLVPILVLWRGITYTYDGKRRKKPAKQPVNEEKQDPQ